MKKLLFALVAVLTAATASAAEGAQIGVGVAVNGPANRITVPINVTPGFRVEPFVGIHRLKETDNTGAVETSRAETNVAVGASALFIVPAAQNVELLGGGRLTINSESVKTDNGTTTTTESGIGFGLAAVGGAEYYLSPRFALGVEAEVGFDTIEVENFRTTTIETGAFLTAKVFFK